MWSGCGIGILYRAKCMLWCVQCGWADPCGRPTRSTSRILKRRGPGPSLYGGRIQCNTGRIRFRSRDENWTSAGWDRYRGEDVDASKGVVVVFVHAKS